MSDCTPNLKEIVDKERETPKWMQKGRPYNIEVKPFKFRREEIDGNFGKKNTVYIVNTKEVGQCYMSVQDFLRFAEHVQLQGDVGRKTYPQYLMFSSQ